MSKDNSARLNAYDFVGFPDRQQRDSAKQFFDMSKLRLVAVNDSMECFPDAFFEQYRSWRLHINSFSTRLGMHIFLMYYQYIHDSWDTIDIKKFESSQSAHKIFFDTFAEDVSLYLISYFDKHLEMFKELYDLQKQSGNNRQLSRGRIIGEMKKTDSLKELASEYRKVEASLPFKEIRKIRNAFVHNKSASYYGMNVTQHQGAYTEGNSKGISTKMTYQAICKLIISYGQLCEKVNSFILTSVEMEAED